MHTLKMTALDPWNPLGFFATLGVLRVVDEHARAAGLERPRLGWVLQGRRHAVLVSPIDEPAVIDAVMADAKVQANNPILTLAHDKSGQPAALGTKGTVQDLKPSPEYARATLDACAAGGRVYADVASAMFSVLVQDGNKNTKPTALHFTAGQQQFVNMIRLLRESLDADRITQALHGWRPETELPSMGWDGRGSRGYALRATNPATAGDKSTVAGANWLAFRGLTAFAVRVRGTSLATVCVSGPWKSGSFTWPVWDAALSAASVSSLLRLDVAALSTAERRSGGVVTVLRSAIQRTDQGGYGSFSPPTMVAPTR